MNRTVKIFHEYYVEWLEYYAGWTTVGWIASTFSLRMSADIATMLAITTFLMFFFNGVMVEKKGLSASLVSGLHRGVSYGMAVIAGMPLGLLLRYVKWLTHPANMQLRGWF